MPNLPTINIPTAEQVDRILAAFAGRVDETGAEMPREEAYRQWLRATLRDHVVLVEAQAMDRQHSEAKQVALEQLRAELL